MPSPKAALPKPNPLAPLVDELGALERDLAPYAARIARVEMLRKAVRNAYATAHAAETFEAAGAHFVALIGARALVRVIDFKALAKALGLAAYAKIATVTLAALEANAPCTVIASVVTSEATGTRSLRIVERGAA